MQRSVAARDEEESRLRLSLGEQVRLVHDPSTLGTIVGEGPMIADRRMLVVQFANTRRQIPEDQLERTPKIPESPLDLLAAARVSSLAHFRQLLTHIRLTGRLADMIYSMEATNTDFHAYQFKSVLKMLGAPTGGLLIADEVGLGKTIEAGLIWTELRARYDLRRLLVVCPKTLVDKWRRELLNRFDVEARAPNAEEMLSLLGDQEQRSRGFSLICTMQGLRPPRGWNDPDEPNQTARATVAKRLEAAADDEPLFDLVVIDEAHHLRNPSTLVHQLGRLLRPVASYMLFLSATPIHLRNQDLFSQLRLLDPESFALPDAFEDILDANRPLVELRDKVLAGGIGAPELRERLVDAQQHSLLRDSEQLKILIEELASERDMLSRTRRGEIAYRLEQINLLAHVVTRTRRRDVQELRVVRHPEAPEIVMSAPERAFYDAMTAVVAQYAVKLDINDRFLLATPQRMMSSCMAAAYEHWQKKAPSLDEEDGDADIEFDIQEQDWQPLVNILAQAARRVTTREALEHADTKYRAFCREVKAYLRRRPGEKLIVFSSFKPTLRYLARRLHQDGIASETIHGDIDERKGTVIARFEVSSNTPILLSSEIGSEGIDLQFSRVVVNYDLPWNPMRLEQRIGRIDRLGQRAETISILNLVHKDTIDDRIYEKLYVRLDLCRRALGDFEAVLGERMRQLQNELLSGTLTPEQQERRIEQTSQALENLRQQEEKLEEAAAGLIAHGDYILQTVRAAHELNRWIAADDLRRYVTNFLERHFRGCRIRQETPQSDLYEIELSAEARLALGDFIQRKRLGQSTRLVRDNRRPVLCRFTPGIARASQDRAELISQLHPLVRFAAAKVDDSDIQRIRPAIAAHIPRAAIERWESSEGRYLVLVEKWSLTGVVAIERLAFAGADIITGKMIEDDLAEALAVAVAAQGKVAPAADFPELGRCAGLGRDTVQSHLDRAFDRFVREREAENNDRAAVQLRTLEKHLASGTERIERIIAEHRAKGRLRLIPAMEGQLSALRARCDRRRHDIEQRRRIGFSGEKVAALAILAE